MLAIVQSTGSNHAGLSVTTKRSLISHVAIARGLTATATNQAARVIRFDTGSSALLQALIARTKVRQIGSSGGLLEDASLSATSLDSSPQIERLRAAA